MDEIEKHDTPCVRGSKDLYAYSMKASGPVKRGLEVDVATTRRSKLVARMWRGSCVRNSTYGTFGMVAKFPSFPVNYTTGVNVEGVVRELGIWGYSGGNKTKGHTSWTDLGRVLTESDRSPLGIQFERVSKAEGLEGVRYQDDPNVSTLRYLRRKSAVCHLLDGRPRRVEERWYRFQLT